MPGTIGTAKSTVPTARLTYPTIPKEGLIGAPAGESPVALDTSPNPGTRSQGFVQFTCVSGETLAHG